ncbi:MAG: hypothetical protein ACXVQS_10345 [Actinomycetota bacterium]
MPTVIAHHEVKDVEHWLASPRREELMGPLGIKVRTFVDPQNPNRVGLLMDVPDMDIVNKMMQSPEAAEAMAYDGVLPETVVFLVES